jgi:hypothetical protein
MQPLLEKLKEKNSSVSKAIGETLSALHRYCWSGGLVDVAEGPLTGIEDPACGVASWSKACC